MPTKFNPIDHPKQQANPRLDDSAKASIAEYMLENMENRHSLGINFVQCVIVLLDLIALLIYFDLFLVVRYKKHIFTWAIESKIIAQR